MSRGKPKFRIRYSGENSRSALFDAVCGREHPAVVDEYSRAAVHDPAATTVPESHHPRQVTLVLHWPSPYGPADGAERRDRSTGWDPREGEAPS